MAEEPGYEASSHRTSIRRSKNRKSSFLWSTKMEFARLAPNIIRNHRASVGLKSRKLYEGMWLVTAIALLLLQQPVLGRSVGGRGFVPVGPSRNFQRLVTRGTPSRSSSALSALTVLRGGANKKPKKNVANAVTSAISGIMPTTRAYLLACLALAVLTLAGVPEVLLYSDQNDDCRSSAVRHSGRNCFFSSQCGHF